MPNERTTFLPLTAAIVAALATAGLGLVAAGDGEVAGDLAITRAIQRLEGAPIEWLARVGNAVGSTGGALVILAVVMLVAALMRAWREVFFLVVLLLLRLLATQLKTVFDSPRPTTDLVEIRGAFDGSGYPSGHATTGMAMALGLSAIAWTWARSRAVAILATALLLLLALLIGLARIWSGAHWASDVLGGYAAGTAIAALAILIRARQPWFTR